MTPDDPDQAQDIWKTQNEETQMVRIKTHPEDLAGLVRSRENLNKFVYWSATAVAGLLAAGFLYNVFTANQPWIRFGQAWALGLLAYVLGTQLPYRPRKKNAQESCVRFLVQQHEERARGYLRLRRLLWLLVPSIAASWLGEGPLTMAKENGLDPSTRLFRFCAGPWPFVLVIAALALVWLAFGAAAGKARQDAKGIGVGDGENA
jgi:hypothetical protein